MIPSGYRGQGYNREPMANGHSVSRSPSQLRHSQMYPIINSPRSPRDAGTGENSLLHLGEKMRMMKSKIGNLSINSRNGINENNLYPTELVFLLSNEQGNIERMRQVTEEEKKRINRDFENFSREINHLIDDLKISLHSQIDNVFRQFIAIYGNMKSQVIRMRQTRKHILQSSTSPLHRPPQNPNSSSLSTSNLNLLHDISRDQQYFKNHRIYQQITTAYFQAIGPIMEDAQNLIAIGSQQQFYQDQKCNKILNSMRDGFFHSTKKVYDGELDQVVLQVRALIEENNIMLKDIYVEDQGRNQKSASLYSQDRYWTQNGTNNHYNSPSNNGPNRKIRENEYGIEAPQFRNPNNINNNPYSNQDPQKSRRPASSDDNHNLKQKPRPNSSRSSKKQTLQVSRQKPHPFQKPHQPLQPQLLTLKDNQTLITQSSQSPTFSRLNSISCPSAQDILLCISFINQGKNIAIGCKDKNIYVYTVNGGKFVTKLVGHQASVCYLANVTGLLASGGDNGCSSLILWDLYQWRMKKKVSLHSAALTCIVDLQDGVHLATGGYDKRIHIFNYKKGQKAFQPSLCRSGVTSLILCQKSRKLVSACLDSTMTVWSIFTRNGQIQSLNMDRIITSCGLVTSLRPLILDSDIVVFGNKEGRISMLNVHNGDTVRTLTVSRSSVIELAIIERQVKPQYPLILSCSSGQREMMLTRSDKGSCESTQVRINIGFGCGIGPKVILDETGLVGIVSQSEVEKQVGIYKIELS